MRIFIFGIGGTGARVLRSLTMLLAAGTKLPPQIEKIIPIIIDVDAHNSDTLRAIKSLEKYAQIRQEAFGDSNMSEGFFNVRLTTLGKEKVESRENLKIKESFQLNFQGIDESFFDYLNGRALDSEDKYLLELLFDNIQTANDPRKELHLKLSQGFKGNPNIGSIIFNDLVNTEEFKYFERSFRDNDRIFIISSIFGGTGSAGFPQLVRNLRHNTNSLLQGAKIGAVVVKPYFAVENNAQSAINSEIFDEKTKAALGYYAKELDGKINSIYYVGDKPGDPYENYEGGANQENHAHIVELLSAMAALEFCKEPDSSFRSQTTNYYEFGANGDTMRMDIGHFYSEVQHDYLQPLTEFSLAGLILQHHFPKNTKQQFYQQLGLSDRNPFFGQLQKFFSEDYFKWIKELEKNPGRKFAPFVLENQDPNYLFDDMVAHAQVRASRWLRGRVPEINSDYLNKLLAERVDGSTKAGISHQAQKLLVILHATAHQMFDQKISPIYTSQS